MFSDKMETYIARIVERVIQDRGHTRHGMVTSYDPKTHRAKVRFQPSGQTSGWLPIHTGLIGNGYGIACGLTAGDGEKTGDLVKVTFGHADFEGGAITGPVHSDIDKPPMVESGEMVIWTQWGQQIRLNKDGSITHKTAVPTQVDQPAQSAVSSPEFTPTTPPTTQKPPQPNQNQKAVTVTIDAQGNHTIEAANDTVVMSQGNVYTQGTNISHSASADFAAVAGGDLGTKAGGKNVLIGGKKVVVQGDTVTASRDSVSVQGMAPVLPKFEVPG